MLNLEVPGLVGLLTSVLIQVLKVIPNIPVVAGQTGKIRTIAAALSFIGNFGTMIATGDLDLTRMVAGTIASYLVAHLTFKAIFHDPNKRPA